MRGEYLIAEWLTTPWALQRAVLAAHTRIIVTRLNTRHGDIGAFDDDREPRERISAFEARRREANTRMGAGGIAVIPVFGTIVQRAGVMTEWCGGSSTQQLSGAFSDALNDPDVSDILLEIDSPGGSVFGVQEFADEIYNARGQKRIIAIANSLSASAAYWLGSQANEFYMTPGGQVGSIGVYTAHEDWSAAMAESGLNVTMISAGEYKTEGSPYAPLSEEAKAHMQAQVNCYYAAFTAAVARGRGVALSAVQSGMGQGRVFCSEAATSEKMVDGIMTLPQLARQMAANAKPGRRRLVQAQRALALV